MNFALPATALVQQLVRMGARHDIAVEEIPTFLQQFAENHHRLLTELRKANGASSDLKALSKAVAVDVEGGRLEEARKRLRSARATEGSGDAAKLRRARILVLEAQIDFVSVDYFDAADRYLEAEKLAASDPASAIDYRVLAAHTLTRQAKAFGDLDAANGAVELLLFLDDPAKIQDLDPARVLGYRMDYGGALRYLGVLTRKADNWRRSIDQFELVLAQVRRGRSPALWANAQHDLGISLLELGEALGDKDMVERAIAAFEKSSEEDTRERTPLSWALTQMHIGNAYSALARRSLDQDHYARAFQAYGNALLVQNRDNAPRDFGTTQYNAALLALSVAHVGIDQGITDHDAVLLMLNEAEVGARSAISVIDRKREPVAWAERQKLLSEVLLARGQAFRDIDDIRGAATGFELSLQELTVARDRQLRARALTGFGEAAHRMGLETGDPEWTHKAIAALDEAVRLYPGDQPLYHAGIAQLTHGEALMRRATELKTTNDAQRALEAFKNASNAFDPDRSRFKHILSRMRQAETHIWLGREGQGTGHFTSAVDLARGALIQVDRKEDLTIWTEIRRALANALHQRGLNGSGTTDLEAALQALDEQRRGAEELQMNTTLEAIEDHRRSIVAEIERRKSEGSAPGADPQE